MGIGLFILGLFKYILIAFLCIFAFLLSAAVFIVLMPIRYNARFSYDKKLEINIAVAWIFKIIRLNYSNVAENGKLKLSVFGKILFGKDAKIADGKKKRKKKRVKKQDSVDLPVDFANDEEAKANTTEEAPGDMAAEKGAVKAESEEYEAKRDNEPHGSDGVTYGRDSGSIAPEEEALFGGIPERGEAYDDSSDTDTDSDGDTGKGIIGRLKELWGKLKALLDYPDKKLIIGATVKLIKRLTTALKPSKVKLKAVIGFDDPGITGRAVGALAFFSGMNGIDLSLQGNFNEQELNFAADIKGKIVLFRFIWPLIVYVLKRPIWKIVKQIIFRKDESNEQH